MKNRTGFIKILLLITIIAGVLVLGGGGYFLIKKYQVNKTEKEKIVQEVQQQKDLEVEKLREEIEVLKNKQLQEVIKPQSKEIITLEVDEGSEVFNEWAKRAVKVTCSWKGYAHSENGKIVEGSGEYIDVEKSGSGTIFFKRNAEIPSVISNSHVVVYCNQCIIAVPNLK